MKTPERIWEEAKAKRKGNASFVDFFPSPNQILEQLSKAEKQPTQHIVNEIGGVVFRPRNFRAAIRNGPPIPLLARGKSSTQRQWFNVKNEAGSDFAEIQLYDEIGEDWFGEGDSAKSFADALNAIPKGRKILVRINSPGGNVYDGIAMYKRLRERAADVTTQIDGVALSIASVVALGGSKVIIAKSGQMMAHDPWTAMYCEGTADDIDEQARLVKDALIAAKKSITAAYVERTGMKEADVSALMSKTTWYVGQEAKDAGFVDEVSNDEAVSNAFDISCFKRVPEAFRKLNNSAALAAGNHKTNMDKATIIALLKEHGIEVDANSTIEQLQAKLKEALKAKAPEKKTETPAAVPAASAPTDEVTNRLEKMEAKYESERKARITNAVNACVSERRIVAGQAEFWIGQAMKDEAILVKLQAMPQQIPAEPLDFGPVIESGASAESAGTYIHAIGNEIVKDFQNRNDSAACSKAVIRAKTLRQHEKALIERWGIRNEGTNTIDSTLKQDLITDIGLRAYARRLAPITQFCTLFSNVPLRGTNKIQVPFLDLDATTPTQWVAANGYVAGDSINDNREVTVDKDYYLGMQITSEEVARQPFLQIAQKVQLKAEGLAFYIWKDFLGLFTTAGANYGIATGWPKAAGAMDSNAIADLQKIADDLDWPDALRFLFVNSTYDNALKKDNAFKLMINIGGTEVMREGKVPDVYGFQYSKNSYLPDNSINLTGVIATKAAALFASAPIPPVQELMAAGTNYSLAIDPDTSIPLEYTSFAEPKYNRFQRVVQARWGKAVGNASAAKLLTSA